MRPTFAEIDLSAIAYNLKKIKKRVHPAKIMAVVKADAYGHGAVPVAKTALAAGAEYLGVALIEEGIELRKANILAPILVFGGAFDRQLEEFFEHNLLLTVYLKTTAEKLSDLAVKRKQKINVHVKVDTGMGRVGVPFDRTVPFIKFVKNLEGINLTGIYTHFATSDEKDKHYANLQLSRFRQVIDQLAAQKIDIPLRHTANSGAIIDLPEAYFDMVRPGIMMYGYYPSNETSESVPIKPAMTFKSRVSFIKDVSANASLSYGRKYVTPKPTRIATIPVGYADGYNRLLSNQGVVTIRGIKFPVVGSVCMDLILVDLGENREIQIDDEVILIGRPEENAFTVEEICYKLNTIPYEVTCWISKRVPRIYKNLSLE